MISRELLDQLRKLEYNLDGITFEKLFVKHGGTKYLAEHLWEKFCGYNNSILKLWSSLTSENQDVMLKVINDILRDKA